MLLASTPAFAGGPKRLSRKPGVKIKGTQKGQITSISRTVERQAAQTVQNTAKRQRTIQPIRTRKPVDGSLPKLDLLNFPQIVPTLENTNHLIGLQELNRYMPAWRQELGSMFDNTQLDSIEQALRETDEWLFARGEDGEVFMRNPEVWNYQDRFLTVLQTSGVSFTQRQIKQLIGTQGVRGFTLNHFFMLQNVRAFCLAKGHSPRMGIQVDGIVLSLAQLRERAKQGDAQAAEWVIELQLGKTLATAFQRWDEKSPEYKALKALYDENRNVAEGKPAIQIIEEVKQFINLHGRTPKMSMQINGEQLTLTKLYDRMQDGDFVAAQLAEELKLGIAMYNGLNQWNKTSPEYQQLKALYDQYRNTKTPTQVLQRVKQFIDKQGRMPKIRMQVDGKCLPLAELRKRAQEGDFSAGQLAEEMELGLAVYYDLKNWDQNSPQWQELNTLNKQFERSVEQVFP